MRWLVGDVQGCARQLERLLREIRFRPGSDELWCLGDLVRRGPDSLETLRIWRDVAGRGVIGNHDIHALLMYSGVRDSPSRELGPLFAAPDSEELLGALRALPAMWHLESPGGGPGVWAIHAGMHPAWSDPFAIAERVNGAPHDDNWFAKAEVAFTTRVRCCTPEGEMSRHTGAPETCPAGYRPWDELYGGAALVVHGHWARRGFYRGPRTIGLDSGCVYGGELTAWCLEEDRFVHVAGHRP